MIDLRRVLVPTDFSDHSMPALRYGVGLAEKFGAELVLLHVVPDVGLVMPDAVMPTPVPAADLGPLTAAARASLAELAARPDLAPLNPRTEVRYGAPATEIVAAAGDLKADLVCLGTHGRGALAHLLLGSVAERVVRLAPCAVLTVRPPG